MYDAAIRAMNARQLAACIARAYEAAGVLLAEIDRTATGSGAVVDITGGGTPRIVGPVEQYGHLATQRGYFTVATTGDRRLRLDSVVEGLDGARVGTARAIERRSFAVRSVRETLSARSEAAGLDPDSMLSSGVRTSTDEIAARLVDIVIDRIEHRWEGDLDHLVSGALAIVPEKAFVADPTA